ncbi:MAG TPA: transporter associated domain-containing protein, partial [Acidimicrobiales bacterium]|nr:transporter associated domain-containing protein [Acidimicrobiales bacterium]
MVRLRRHHRVAEPAGPTGPSVAIQHQIVEALPRLAAMTAREIMTPRVDVVALRLPVSAADVAQAVKESGHSHYPVYRDDLDHLAGVLFVKDLFRSGGEPRLRKPFLVPEGRLVLELLQEMRQRRRAFAVVVDEYGGIEGVLTIKDVVSELVGDLRDEFDPEEEPEVTRIDARRWLVGGQTSLDDLEEDVGVKLPPGEYVTLGGFLFDRFGRIPAEHDTLLHDGWEFRISEMDR